MARGLSDTVPAISRLLDTLVEVEKDPEVNPPMMSRIFGKKPAYGIMLALAFVAAVGTLSLAWPVVFTSAIIYVTIGFFLYAGFSRSAPWGEPLRAVVPYAVLWLLFPIRRLMVNSTAPRADNTRG